VIATKLVVLGLVVLSAIAAADAFRGEGEERTVSNQTTTTITHALVGPAPQYVAAGDGMRTHVNRNGREFLTEAQIDAAFPAPLEGLPFDIAHTAVAPDGTLALAVYKLPPTGPIRAAVELWRSGELVKAFIVPTGAFGGGLGFTSDGRHVATVTPDGHTAVLFSRAGARVGRIPVTSW
jgi:hypothetical protein